MSDLDDLSTVIADVADGMVSEAVEGAIAMELRKLEVSAGDLVVLRTARGDLAHTVLLLLSQLLSQNDIDPMQVGFAHIDPGDDLRSLSPDEMNELGYLTATEVLKVLDEYPSPSEAVRELRSRALASAPESASASASQPQD